MRAILILISFLITSCTYYPGKYKFDKIQEAFYTAEKNERQMGQVYIPKGSGPFPGVVIVHGGGWDSRTFSDMDSVAESLAANGFVVYNINYRLAPNHRHPDPIIDLKNALTYFKIHSKEYKLDPARIGLWGYSSGGHIVTSHALIYALDKEHRVQAVVAGGTPFDFTWYPYSPIISVYMGNFRDKMLDQYFKASPMFMETKGAPPFYIYHAKEDKLVEFAQSTAFEAKLKASNIPVKRHGIGWWGHATAFIFSKKAVKNGIIFLKKTL